jgi:hypothetical protein
MTDAMTAYFAADAACTAHFPIFQSAQDAYRTMKIGDAEFLAARKAYDDLLAAFDVAYAAVQDEPEEVEAVMADDTQPDLFA